MKYTKKQLKDSLNNKTDNNSKSSLYILILINIPIYIAICIAFPYFLATLALLILVIPSMLAKNLDVALGNVDIGDFLVLGNLSMSKSQYYAFDSKVIKQEKYAGFFMSDFFLSSRTKFKNEYLNHHIVKINCSRLRKSKILVEVFDFTLMDTDRLEIFNHICRSIYPKAPYKSIRFAEKAFKNYLKEICEIYPNTKVKYYSERRHVNYWHVKNIEKHLQENPLPFIDFVMGKDYPLPLCHRYNLAGEQLEEVSITESDFAKILYYDVLEAVSHAPKASNIGKHDYYFNVDRM